MKNHQRKVNQIFHCTRCITPKGVRVCEPHLCVIEPRATQLLSKKCSSCGKPLAGLCPIWPVGDLKLRPLSPGTNSLQFFFRSSQGGCWGREPWLSQFNATNEKKWQHSFSIFAYNKQYTRTTVVYNNIIIDSQEALAPSIQTFANQFKYTRCVEK